MNNQENKVPRKLEYKEDGKYWREQLMEKVNAIIDYLSSKEERMESMTCSIHGLKIGCKICPSCNPPPEQKEYLKGHLCGKHCNLQLGCPAYKSPERKEEDLDKALYNIFNHNSTYAPYIKELIIRTISKTMKEERVEDVETVKGGGGCGGEGRGDQGTSPGGASGHGVHDAMQTGGKSFCNTPGCYCGNGYRGGGGGGLGADGNFEGRYEIK